MTNLYAIQPTGGTEIPPYGIRPRFIERYTGGIERAKLLTTNKTKGCFITHMAYGWDVQKDMYASSGIMGLPYNVLNEVAEINLTAKQTGLVHSIGAYHSSHPQKNIHHVEADQERIPFDMDDPQHMRDFEAVVEMHQRCNFDTLWLDNANTEWREWMRMARYCEDRFRLGGEAIPLNDDGTIRRWAVNRMPWYAISRYVERHNLLDQVVPEGKELVWAISDHPINGEKPTINTSEHIKKAIDNGWSIGIYGQSNPDELTAIGGLEDYDRVILDVVSLTA